MFSSMNSSVAAGLRRKSVYMAMTMPGVQKPHCDPCSSAIRLWMGCRPARMEPMPSTVVTAHESSAHTGARHAFTEKCSGF
jgi:hypothetical protein